MAKIIKLSDKLGTINFYSPQQEYDEYRRSFLASELGLIYQSIPWKDLIGSLRPKRKQAGRKSPSITMIKTRSLTEQVHVYSY